MKTDYTPEPSAGVPAAEEGQLIADAGTARRPETLKRRRIDGGFVFVVVVALCASTAVWILKGPERFFAVLGDDAQMLVDIAPKVVAAVLLAAWLRLLVPQAVIARQFGENSGLRGLLLAIGAGAIVPGGPMTAFPLAVSFGRAGADSGTVVAFLSSWLLVGFNRAVVWEMAFIDHSIVGWRMALCLPLTLLLGLAARRLGWPSVRMGDDR